MHRSDEKAKQQRRNGAKAFRGDRTDMQGSKERKRDKCLNYWNRYYPEKT